MTPVMTDPEAHDTLCRLVGKGTVRVRCRVCPASDVVRAWLSPGGRWYVCIGTHYCSEGNGYLGLGLSGAARSIAFDILPEEIVL